MEKEFINYTEALALKELGFESPYPIGGYRGGKVFYYENGELYYDGRPMYSSDAHSGQLLAPLYQQAFSFFRDKYNMNILIISTKSYWFFNITWDGIIENFKEFESEEKYSSYEEAELECLKKLIELCKKN
jgi:hypothetical protein